MKASLHSLAMKNYKETGRMFEKISITFPLIFLLSRQFDLASFETSVLVLFVALHQRE